MTRRERVIQAISHHETDIVPYTIWLTQEEHGRVTRYINDHGYKGDPNILQRIRNHIYSVYYSGDANEMDGNPGYFQDDFGVIWNRSGVDKDIGIVSNHILPEPVIKNIRMPELDAVDMDNRYKTLMANPDDVCKIGDIGFLIYERAWTLRGMENFFTDMLWEPDFVDALLDQLCDYHMQIVDIALRNDVDGFLFSDDWGQQKETIMGLKLWRRFIKPRMARLFSRVKSEGKFVALHSCGDIHELFPDLIDMGLDVYQTFQPEIYDIRKIKREYGGYLSFWGGISTQRLLPYATPDEVKKTTREIMGIMSKNGGYIAGPTHCVPYDVPPENVIALIETFESQ